jgi:PIN domain nuclease of toxin-antitoxin system
LRALLDTHGLLWFLAGDPRLSGPARAVIEDASQEVLVSMATLWEIAIKQSLGKLRLARPFEEMIPLQPEVNGFAILDIRIEHLSLVRRLEFHHRDPFDRLLVAQALAEDIPILSQDRALDAYGVHRLW